MEVRSAQPGGGFALGAGTEGRHRRHGDRLRPWRRWRATDRLPRPHHASDRGFPSLPCAGLVDGTSGAPWLADPVIAGLIGGLEGGGCEENVSYSPPFDDEVKRLQARAEAGGPGDDAPTVVRRRLLRSLTP